MRLNRGGFSLMELLVVISMIAMICAMGMVRLGDALAGYELSAAELELASDLRWLQQMSVNSPVSAGGSVYTMVFNKETKAGYVVKNGIYSCKRGSLPDSVRFANRPSDIWFSETGGPSAPQSIALLSTKLNKTRFVIVAAVTGRVRVSDTAAAQ